MLRSIFGKNNSKQKNEQKKPGFFSWLQTTTTVSSSQSTFLCTENQCTMPAQTMSGSTIPQSSFSYFSSHGEENLFADTNYLSKILPPGYYEALKQAAKLGFLYAFISATPIYLFENHFRSCGMTPAQINFANHIIRIITILSLLTYLGLMDMKSLCMTIGMPLSTIALKSSGINDTFSQLLPIGLMLTAEISTDLSNTIKLLSTFIIAAGSSWLGSQAAKLGFNIIRHGLFSLPNEEVKLNISDNHELALQQALKHRSGNDCDTVRNLCKMST